LKPEQYRIKPENQNAIKKTPQTIIKKRFTTKHKSQNQDLNVAHGCGSFQVITPRWDRLPPQMVPDECVVCLWRLSR